MGLLRRRYPIILLVAGCTFAVFLLAIVLMVPKYEAQTLLRIDPTHSPLAVAQGGTDVNVNSETIETEVSILQSEALAREVVRRLDLGNYREFNRVLEKASAKENLDEDDKLSLVASEVRKHLSVNRDRLSYLIAINFESEDALTAAKVANTYAEAYLDMTVGSRMGTAQRQADWFQKRLATLAKEVKEADAQLAQYKAGAGIVEGGQNGTVADQQIAPLSAQLTGAQAAAAASRSELAAARQQVASGGIEAVSKVRDSAVIADLRRQRAEVLRDMAELTTRYGEKHPQVVQVRQQLNSIDAQIRAEAERVVASIEAETKAAVARVASLKASMNALEAQRERNARVSVGAQSLEREAVNKRQAYDRMAQIAMETTQAAQNSIPQAEIVDRATVPTNPKWPGKTMLAVFAAIVSLSLGASAAILLELLAPGVQTASEVETRFNLPVLAALPFAGRRFWFQRKSQVRPPDKLLEEPAGAFAESARNAHVSIVGLRSTNASPQIVAITSSLPGEGKTSSALSIARVAALGGIRTLLVDCDLRRAALRDYVDTIGEIGTAEVLKGEATLDQAVQADIQPSLDILPVVEPDYSAENLFSNTGVPALIQEIRSRYELIVLDLPPVIGLTDTRFVCALADAVILAIKWRSTPVSAIESALTTLSADAVNLKGVILTMVDPASETSGASYYSSRYAAYYQPQAA